MKKRRLLFKYVTPAIISMVSVFLFTIVDGIFVGRGVGTDALGAVNIVFPYVMFFMALVTMFTVGGMTVTAIRIGRGDKADANIAFRHSINMCLVTSIILSLLATLETEPICRLLGATDIFIKQSCEYLFWYGVFFVPCGFFIALCGTLRNDDSPVLVSVAVVVSSLCNIFGDWLLIFPFHMGVRGAAIATGVSQCIAVLILLTHFIRKKGILRFGACRLDRKLVRKITVRGLPECVNQFSIPVTVVAMNLVLQKYVGRVGVNTFALISYVVAFAQAVSLGVAEGIQPLFGRAYGEGNRRDLKYYLKWGMAISFVGSLVIVTLLFVMGPSIYLLFNAEKETLCKTVQATHIFSWGFLVQSLVMIITAYLYSTKRSKQAFIINLLRSFVVNLIVIAILPMIFGAGAIWFCFFVYEGIALIVATIMLKRADRRLFSRTKK